LVTGLDPDHAILALARRRAEAESASVQFVEGRAERLPFGDATFDRVMAVTVLCFVPQADRAVAEMARVLKPGGVLVIGELGRWSLWAAYRRIRGWIGNPVWRAARFRTAGELRRLIGASGLEVSRTRGAVFYPPCAITAELIAPIDGWLGRWSTFGATFVAVSASKPPPAVA
jgi:SAM-dependent methyltransferase